MGCRRSAVKAGTEACKCYPAKYASIRRNTCQYMQITRAWTRLVLHHVADVIDSTLSLDSALQHQTNEALAPLDPMSDATPILGAETIEPTWLCRC